MGCLLLRNKGVNTPLQQQKNLMIVKTRRRKKSFNKEEEKQNLVVFNKYNKPADKKYLQIMIIKKFWGSDQVYEGGGRGVGVIILVFYKLLSVKSGFHKTPQVQAGSLKNQMWAFIVFFIEKYLIYRPFHKTLEIQCICKLDFGKVL